ncbi:hypothetical protein MY11210_001209 [Beauveria gryllotalpidicola]
MHDQLYHMPSLTLNGKLQPQPDSDALSWLAVHKCHQVPARSSSQGPNPSSSANGDDASNIYTAWQPESKALNTAVEAGDLVSITTNRDRPGWPDDTERVANDLALVEKEQEKELPKNVWRGP